jgi:TRAP-type C4-dicarboxylate transport system permease small subunit
MWLEKAIGFLEKVAHPPSRIMNCAGFGFLFTLMLLVALNVAGRYFFRSPITGTVELIEFWMIFVVFLGLGYCAMEHGNISIGLLVDRLPPRAQAVVNAVTCFLSIIIVSLITWQSLMQMNGFWHSGHVSGVLRIPYFPFLIVLVLGYAAFDLILIANFLQYLRGGVKK